MSMMRYQCFRRGMVQSQHKATAVTALPWFKRRSKFTVQPWKQLPVAFYQKMFSCSAALIQT